MPQPSAHPPCECCGRPHNPVNPVRLRPSGRWLCPDPFCLTGQDVDPETGRVRDARPGYVDPETGRVR